jgi:hypothetical protein
MDDDKKIIIYKHFGLLSLNEIRDVWDMLVQMKEFTVQGYNLISDYSEADFAFSVQNMGAICDYYDTVREVMKGKKEAIITSKPRTTALSVLFENETLRNLNFEAKTFSTYEVAVDWLMK